MLNFGIDNNNNQLLQAPDYQKILQKQDFFPKIFLIPSQIKLHKDHGLMVIKRNQAHPDKYQQQMVLPITIDQNQIRTYNQLPNNQKHPAGHGLLSLFKRTPTRRIKLAICICVYSQPKHMLKSTIKGIQQSYQSFLSKAGIMPHQIIMIVMFDGIEKINNSKDQTQNMISFFNEVDIKNGFTYKPYGKTLQEYLKQLQQKNFNFSDLHQQMNNDHISLFTQEQLTQLKTKLFQYQYNEYNRIKQLLKDVQNLKKQKDIKIDSLPNDVLKKYQQLSLNFCIQNNMWYQNQQQIQQYLSSKKNIRIKLIYQSLHQTQMLCKRYIQSREDKAILYPIRLADNDLNNPRQVNEEEEGLKEKANKNYNYMFFCVKHKNQGKLSSHMLFFQGFCKLFDPQYCILTDVGVKPQKDAIYKMWAHMQKHPKVGGVCGYMGLKLQNPSDQLGYRDDGYDQEQLSCLTTKCDWFFTVQRAQQFQYHFAHMLDKAFESAFGYIHVLPGAFSGYRWKALKSVSFKGEQQNYRLYQQGSQTQRQSYSSDSSQQQQGETLMKRYLKTAMSSNIQISLQDSNMYLAEDRIMCLGIHALGYDLAYLPDAQSVVDPVTSLTRLLGQRRRWINGSWFAFNYVREHSYESNSCLFYIQLIYYSFVQKLQWIQISIFFIAMNLTLVSATRQHLVPAVTRFFLAQQDYQLYNYRVSIFNVRNVIDSIPDVVNFLYIIFLFANLLYAALVNHNNLKFKKIYYISSTVFGIYGILVFAILVVNTAKIIIDMINGEGKEDFVIPLVYLRALIIFVIIGHALPILWTCSFRKYVEMITSLLSYLYYSPTYINILQIFAFARIDDLSWGTKGLDMADTDSIERQWQRRKYVFILQFVTSNIVLSYILVKLSQFDYFRNIIILGSTCLVTFLLMFRLVFGLFYIIKYYCARPWKRFSTSYINQNRQNGNRILNALNTIQLKIKQIEKQKTKRKKQQQYKRIATATSDILSRTLSNFGNKLRSKVAHHMVSNNIIPKRELDPRKRLRNRKKITLKKNLNIVEEMSNEEDQQTQKNIMSYKNLNNLMINKDNSNKQSQKQIYSNNNDINNNIKSQKGLLQKYKNSSKNLQKQKQKQQPQTLSVPQIHNLRAKSKKRIQQNIQLMNMNIDQDNHNNFTNNNNNRNNILLQDEIKQQQKNNNNDKNGYNIVVPENISNSNSSNNNKADIRARIQAIKGKRNKKE